MTALTNRLLLDQNIQFERIQGLRKYGLKFFDIHCKLNDSGKMFSGRGSDLNPNVAIIKSIAESVERNALENSRYKNSNGIAAHTVYECAARNAIYELIERHMFFTHFLLQLPFRKFCSKSIVEKIGLNSYGKFEIITATSQINIEEGAFAICILNGKTAARPWGIICGTGFSESLELACEQAIIEALRYFNFYEENNEYIEPLSEGEFGNITGSYKLEHHARLALDISYANWFMQRYLSDSLGAKNLRVNALDLIGEVEINSIPSSLNGLKDYFKVVRAASCFAQDLFVGPTNLAKINLAGIEKFALLAGLESYDVVSKPHPLR